MKALVYHGPGRRVWDQVPEPAITDPEDVIVRIDAVTICGTDLHILRGHVPDCEPPRILGHEAVGTIAEIGSAVRNRKVGDRVLISCISSCGRCSYCRQGRYGQCLGGGGWILGHRIDGVQAEMARVPFADLSTYLLPEQISDESALLLADILPTAFEVGVLASGVQPGDTVAIVGAGPIGLAAIRTSRLFSPGAIVVFDPAEPRREAAKVFGADVTADPHRFPEATVRELSGGLGADVVIEAVGRADSFELCTRLVRPGGHVSNVGVHGTAANLHLEDLWTKDIALTTGLVDTNSTERLLRMVASGLLSTEGFITHRFGTDEMQEAYDVFARPADTGALKVALFRT